MNYKLLIVTLLFGFSLSFGQYISLDTNQTPEQLRDLLTTGSCMQFTSVNRSSNNAVGYFNKNSSIFPFDEGVVIRSGDLNQSAGPYNNSNLSTTTGQNLVDAYLQNLSNQTSGQTDPLRDIAFFEFDFSSISNFISFNFIFASNEYGEFQCLSNDTFAIVLTNLNTGVSVNLAVVPGLSQAISVRTIRDGAFNNSCASANASFFGNYNVNNPLDSPINFRGNTIPLNASSLIQPNIPYRIRFVIADFSDTNYDSALFIKGNSFQTSINLGADTTLCAGESLTINAGLDNSFTYNWYLDNVLIAGSNNSTLTVTQPGEYRVEATRGSCLITDTIVISQLTINSPNNLQACNEGNGFGTFNLTNVNHSALGLDPSIYQLVYCANLNNFNANIPIPQANLSSFVSSGQTIYVGVLNVSTQLMCTSPVSFSLIVRNQFQAGQNVSQSFCETGAPIDFNLIDLAPNIINGNLGAFTIDFYVSQFNAENHINPINSAITLPAAPGTIVFWARMYHNGLVSCYDVVPVPVTVNPRPLVDVLVGPYQVCNEFVFPPIANGAYYSLPNGQGTMYLPGQSTFLEGVYYIFNGPNAFGCTNESSFYVYVAETFMPDVTACSSYTVEAVPENMGEYYTALGGPSGTGQLIPFGTIFTNSGTTDLIVDLYFYSVINGVLCRDELIQVTISPEIVPYTFNNINTCEPYTLPTLSTGGYFTEPSGGGTQYFGGDIINNTLQLYIYQTNTNCVLNELFQINFLDLGQTFLITECGTYLLPPITFGNYFSAPNGGGNIIDPLIPITSSQTIYHYAVANFGNNCFSENVYNITINPVPAVDEILVTQNCGPYSLPTLSNGNYYLLSGGPSVTGQQQLFPNMVIDLTGNNLVSGQTYYIYSGPNTFGCYAESSFNVSIISLPQVDPFGDLEVCSAYSLSATNGQIYNAPNGPNGSGSLVLPSQVFNSSQTFYIYAESSNGCTADLPFTRFYYGIDLPTYATVYSCASDNYQLPPLTHMPNTPSLNYSIGYFFSPGGVNPVPNGYVFNQEGTYTIYVYAVNPGRFITCTEERSFIINIGTQPIIPSYNIYQRAYCNSFTLPPLPIIPNATVNYYSAPGGQAANLISPTNYSISQIGTNTIWVYAYSNINPDCFSEISFSFEVISSPNMSIPNAIICVDPLTNIALAPAILYSNVNPAIYTVEWYLNNNLVHTGPTYTTFNIGAYEVRAFVTNPGSSTITYCDYNNFTVTVDRSSIALADVTVSPPFYRPNSAIVNINGGYGVYEFNLDDQGFQSNNIFENLATGYHQVIVRDIKNNCGAVTLEFFIIDFPPFFTPNGDGYNDQWNINRYQSALIEPIIYIHDRYGKLVHVIKSENQGWDGKYNGIELPSTDYWFIIEFLDKNLVKQSFKSNFSLKR
jgi:gliding motility-associated-like protein